MPDLLGDYREALIERATRQAEWALSNRAVPTGVSSGPGVPTVPGTTASPQFMTGYDAGVTVVPFMLDFSTLDGPDLLVG